MPHISCVICTRNRPGTIGQAVASVRGAVFTEDDVSIVFSSDQNGTHPKFVEFARGAHVLVMHLAIAAGATSALHAAPAVVGRVAQDAGVGRLIVSHIGQFDLEAAIAELKKSYTGPLTIGADLQCTSVP